MTNTKSAAFEAAGQKCIKGLEHLGWPVHRFVFDEIDSQPIPAKGNALSRQYERRAERTNDREVAAHYVAKAREAALGTGDAEMDSKVEKTTAFMENYASELRQIGCRVDKAAITAVSEDGRVLFTFDTGDDAVTVQARAAAERYERVAKSVQDREAAKFYRDQARKIREQLGETKWRPRTRPPRRLQRSSSLTSQRAVALIFCESYAMTWTL